jgi:hypothetical protein
MATTQGNWRVLTVDNGYSAFDGMGCECRFGSREEAARYANYLNANFPGGGKNIYKWDEIDKAVFPEGIT